MKTTDEIMGLVVEYGRLSTKALMAADGCDIKKAFAINSESLKVLDSIRAALTALASGECSVAGLADDLRLVAKLESKRMGAMSSGLIKGVIDRLSALPPPPAEGTVA